MTWQPKLRPKGFPHSLDDFAIASLTELEHRSRMGDDKRDQRVFRVKRKHVLKACDRCRVKKTKCDGKQPCNRCSVYNHPCLFRERKATQTKVYSRGFVEMLESHHALVVKALQKLYKFCINKEGFPGEPLAEAPDGHPLTHTILDRLGLIKQAEEKADEADEDSEDLRYLRILSSTECSATAEPSPEPTTPQEPSPTTSSRASVCQTVLAPMASRGRSTWQWDMQSVPQTSFSYPGSGFQDLYPSSRPSVGSADLNPGDISPNLDLSSISMISQESQRQDLRSLAYFLDPLCNIESTSSTTGIKHAGRLNHGLEMSETSAQPTGDLSGDLLSDFTFSTHEHALYQGFNSGWTFSSV